MGNKAIGIIVVVALVCLVPAVTTQIATSSKYGPPIADFPSHELGWKSVEYSRSNEGDLNEIFGQFGVKPVYRETGGICNSRGKFGVVTISEFITDNEAKKFYELACEEYGYSHIPTAIDIGDEGVSFSGDEVVILFKEGNFVVEVDARDSFPDVCEDVARITEQSIITATAPAAPEKGVPGFEAIFALGSLLTLAYFVLRRRK